MLILVTGLPATGKSTVSKRLGHTLKAEILRTDIIRKELFNKPLYTDTEKEIIYKTLLLIAGHLLKQDIDVILDGTFYKKEPRDQARKLAKKHGKRFFIVETRCPEEIALSRLANRKRNLKSPSDADQEVYLKVKNLFEKIDDEHILIDTGWNIKEAVKDLVKKIKA